MSLLSGFNVSLDELQDLAEAAMAAFVGGTVPGGWTVITPQQLGLAAQYQDGNYFTDPSSGASAIVLQQGNDYIISFRGTDGDDDVNHYPELFFGTYVNHYQPLLNAIAASAPAGTDFYFTGASLGGGATNLMANIAASQYGGLYASAKFVGFASPNISNANGILNFGLENDPVYRALNNYSAQASSLDHLVLATSEYMAGNYDGRHPFDAYAHSIGSLGLDALNRLSNSMFFDVMQPDSVIIFDTLDNGLVQDVTPGRESTGAFYLGQSIADQISGRNGNDYIEGFGGDDTLSGGGGDDVLVGGIGADMMFGGAGNDAYFVDNAGDQVTENVSEGTDTVYSTAHLHLGANIEYLVLQGSADLQGYGNAQTNVINGNSGNNLIDGGGGADTMYGGAGNDAYFVDNPGDIVVENLNEGTDTVYSTAHLRLGANIEYLVLQGSADLQGYGNAQTNVINGNSGNNLIDGGSGADTMYGGAGNDAYFVDNPGDIVVENLNEGTDTVYSTAHLRLGANIEYLVLQGSADLQGYGNAQTNVINGNSGNNLIDGGGGADTMYGGAGNDAYFVDNPGDIVVENLNEGTDTVYSTAHLRLGANIEYLVLQGSADLQGYGNAQTNVINGNSGNNLIDGGGGADTMYGGAGNDAYFVDNAGDQAIENLNEGTDTVYSTAHLRLGANIEHLVLQGSVDLQGYGNELANTLVGNSGNNLLDGGAGADKLIGGAGNDAFYFKAGEANGDTITDFTGNGAAAGDMLYFSGYGAGATFTNIDATHWQVNYGGGASHDVITFSNAAAIHASDYFFV